MGGFPGSVLLSQGDILLEYSEKRHPLGTRGYTRDGRVFRYAKSSAAIGRGRLVQAAAPSALDDALSLAASTDCNTTYTTDSKTIYLSSGNSIATANCFDDGYLFVSSGTSHTGQYAQIKDSPKHSGAAGTFADITIYTDEGWTKALTTSCKVGLIRNVYDDVRVCDTSVASGTLTSMQVGVTVRAISAADKYFWLQTWGPCACITHAALTIGMKIQAATATGSTDGVISVVTTKALNLKRIDLGQVLQVGAANTAALIYLQLAP